MRKLMSSIVRRSGWTRSFAHWSVSVPPQSPQSALHQPVFRLAARPSRRPDPCGFCQQHISHNRTGTATARRGQHEHAATPVIPTVLPSGASSPLQRHSAAVRPSDEGA